MFTASLQEQSFDCLLHVVLSSTLTGQYIHDVSNITYKRPEPMYLPPHSQLLHPQILAYLQHAIPLQPQINLNLSLLC